MGESTIFKGDRVQGSPHLRRQGRHRLCRNGFDAFALCDRFEAKLEQYSGNLERAAVELAQEWRSDKAMRKLEAS